MPTSLKKNLILNPDHLISLPHPWEFEGGNDVQMISDLWYKLVRRLKPSEITRLLYSNHTAEHNVAKATIETHIGYVVNAGRWHIEAASELVDLDGYHPIIKEIFAAVMKHHGKRQIKTTKFSRGEDERLKALEADYFQRKASGELDGIESSKPENTQPRRLTATRHSTDCPHCSLEVNGRWKAGRLLPEMSIEGVRHMTCINCGHTQVGINLRTT